MERFDAEDMMLKFDDVEDSIQVVKEFVVDKIKDFDNRLMKLEKSISEVSLSDVSDFDGFSSSLSGEISPMAKGKPLSSSSPIMSGLKSPNLPRKTSIPTDLEELPDKSLRAELAKFMPSTLDPKEKFNKVQMAFFLHWVSQNDPKGKLLLVFLLCWSDVI